jgi:peptide/nickel transport system substrate-binding protein
MLRADRVRRVLGLFLVFVALAGCSLTKDEPTPPPSPTVTARPFTVMSTDPVRVTDPAAMTDAASAMLALNVFQRLMTAEPGGTALKPDAARDCLFTSATTYTCTLNPDLTFQNGHLLTSSDVKFSIERATRLNVAGSSASLLGSLRKIETPDDVTIRFLLSRVDTQFGWALASPAASLVDEEVYDTDEIRPPKETAIGSGPYAVFDYSDKAIELTRFPAYIGFNRAILDNLVYRTAPDSATIEDAMDKGTVDVVWRGLSNPAITRYTQQLQQNGTNKTTNGFSPQVLTGKRVLQIGWSAQSGNRTNKPLRQAIAVALQGDRTLDSVVPGGVPGHITSFPLGGRAIPKVTWKSRINLTLGYDSTAPNGQDIATQIRTRLENTGGLSVQLRPNNSEADLVLVDRKAWTPTAVAWLQPYLDAPLSGSKTTVESTENQFRATYDEGEANRLIGVLQKQANTDQVVLPISQSDELVYVRAGVQIAENSYGPGWQLGLFGVNYV